MQTLPAQFVFPHPPTELLLFLGAILVIWAVVRVIKDARTWFKEKALNDHRTFGKNPEKSRLRDLLIFLMIILVTGAIVCIVNFVQSWFS